MSNNDAQPVQPMPTQTPAMGEDELPSVPGVPAGPSPSGPSEASRRAPSRRPLMRGLQQAPPRIPPDLQKKMAAMVSRNAQASPKPPGDPLHQAAAGMSQLNLGNPASPIMNLRSPPIPSASVQRRRGPKLQLKDIVGSESDGADVAAAGLGAGIPNRNVSPVRRGPSVSSTPFSNFKKIVDPSGALNFGGKAVLHATGVDFSNGSSFAINMNQLQLAEELGRGNYGTVKKVLHKPTNVAMAMKEIRLELDDSKLNAILMELDILHRAVSPEIVEFYGAFFIESCVYYCMEYMDAGSLDKLQGAGVPEDVLACIASSMTRGLRFLKDQLQIIHRDVKPTNVLLNTKGQVKLCDFGVSGQLEKSLAKTNIGCQSYMAPERIKGESQNNLGTYTVSSDVWSLGLSLVEIACGKYPYPPETYANVFAQLTAIVHGPAPELPDNYSQEAKDFVASCLRKESNARATYAMLMEHPFLVRDHGRDIDMVGWVTRALQFKEQTIQPSLSER